MSTPAVEGLEKLRKAALLMIIASILVAAGALAVAPMFMAMTGIRGPHGGIAMVGALASLSAMELITILGVVLSLAATFAYLVPAFSAFREHDEERYGTAANMIKIGYVYGFILLLVGLLVLFGGLAAGPAGLAFMGIAAILVLIGCILVLIGFIGLIIGMVRLRDEYGETLFLVAAILFIIGIFINIAMFVAWILVYIAAGSALKKTSMA